MKTLTKEIRLLPERVTLQKGLPSKVWAAVRALPDRALFWVGALLFVSGVLEVESLPE